MQSSRDLVNVVIAIALISFIGWNVFRLTLFLFGLQAF